MLVAFGHVLSFLVLFVAAAQSAEHSGFSQAAAFLCGAGAIMLTRLYVGAVVATQRAIDTWDWPNRKEPVWPVRIPLWAVVVYAAIGLAVVLMVGRTRSYPAMEAFVAAAAGCNLLNYLWTRRTRPDTPEALQVVDGWLASPPAAARSFSITLGFLLLFGCVGAHAFESGFAQAAAARCGAACAAPGFAHLAAVLCGLAAIVFVMVYAVVTEAMRWLAVDSWAHVRPGPPPTDMSTWVIVLHVLLGFVVFFAIAAYATPVGQHALGDTYLMVEEGFGTGRPVTLNGQALFELAMGWWIGGSAVLKFFWLRRRARR